MSGKAPSDEALSSQASKLKKTTTTEKNPLPTKDQITQEKTGK